MGRIAPAHDVESFSGNPIDLIEQAATGLDWHFERSGDREIVVSLSGHWADYQISVEWRQDLEGLHMACLFDFKVPEARQAEINKLVALANEQLWIGHFDLWDAEGALMYRYGLLLAGGARSNVQQCETMMRMAFEACERFFPAFQYVIWGGMTATAALEASIFETAGEA